MLGGEMEERQVKSGGTGGGGLATPRRVRGASKRRPKS